MAADSVFGDIDGYSRGVTFRNRQEVRDAGLHRHLQAGISGNFAQGADAIVVSGGYLDDEDEGDTILYTGQGGRDANSGRQVADQAFDYSGNLGLVRSEQGGFPVRVIRGAEAGSAHAPSAGYRYDGLYIVNQHWIEPSKDGPLVCRFLLQKEAPGEGVSFGSIHGPASTSPPTGRDQTNRCATTVQRIVRNTAIAQWVKEVHDFTCQVCGIRLEVGPGAYAEGAHIRPLGSPHNGPDVATNLLCLCPNHHVLFDKGEIYVRFTAVFETASGRRLGELHLIGPHGIDETMLAYHRRAFAQQSD